MSHMWLSAKKATAWRKTAPLLWRRHRGKRPTSHKADPHNNTGRRVKEGLGRQETKPDKGHLTGCEEVHAVLQCAGEAPVSNRYFISRCDAAN